jgi:hypothetical protein
VVAVVLLVLALVLLFRWLRSLASRTV